MLALALLSGCVHGVDVAPSALPRLLTSRPRAFTHGGREVTIQPEMAAELTVRRDCAWVDLVFDPSCVARAPLNDVDLDGDGDSLTLRVADDLRVLPLEEVVDAHLELSHWVPPDFQQHLAIGLTIFAPSALAALSLSIIPTPELGFDLGGLAAAHGLATYFVGARVRPLSWGIARPFVGVALSFLGLSSDEPGADTYRQRAVGVRCGVDLELGARRWLLTFEIDLMRRLDDDEDHYFGHTHPWLPMGGASIGYVLF